MAYCAYAFAQNKLPLVSKLLKNDRLAGKIHLLYGDTKYWSVGPSGLLFIDVDQHTFESNHYQECNPYVPISSMESPVRVNLKQRIKAKGCNVSFLPNTTILKYFKQLAQRTQSLIGLAMVHERGDSLYDAWSYIFDYRPEAERPKWTTRQYGNYELQVQDFLERESFYASYEICDAHSRYISYAFEGVPLRLTSKKRGGCGSGVPEALYWKLGIKRFPYLTNICCFSEVTGDVIGDALRPFVLSTTKL